MNARAGLDERAAERAAVDHEQGASLAGPGYSAQPEPVTVSAVPASIPSAVAAFKLRRYAVTVSGYGEDIYLATTRGKALADAWRCDAFSGSTFGEFLKFARCRLTDYQIAPAEITVSGKPAFGVGHNGQYVQFVYPGGEFVLNAHPLDVLPESVRPRAYQSAQGMSAGTAKTERLGAKPASPVGSADAPEPTPDHLANEQAL